MVQRFEDLEVWQKAHKLVLEIYKTTKYYPSDERFGLISQMRRAAISVPSNIAEGFRKQTAKDKIKFYNISQGSLDELHYYLILSADIGYVTDNSYSINQAETIAKMLTNLIKAIKENNNIFVKM